MSIRPAHTHAHTHARTSRSTLLRAAAGLALAAGMTAGAAIPAQAHVTTHVTTASATTAAPTSGVLGVADRYVGTRYRSGGTTPAGFDCSGYVQHVYGQLGVGLPRTAAAQMHSTTRVPASQARAGDLVFYTSGGRVTHAGIYAGGGQMYDAGRTGKAVSKRAMWPGSVVYGRV